MSAQRTVTVRLDNRHARFAPSGSTYDLSSRQTQRWLERKVKESMRRGIAELTARLRAEQAEGDQPGR